MQDYNFYDKRYCEKASIMIVAFFKLYRAAKHAFRTVFSCQNYITSEPLYQAWGGKRMNPRSQAWRRGQDNQPAQSQKKKITSEMLK